MVPPPPLQHAYLALRDGTVLEQASPALQGRLVEIRERRNYVRGEVLYEQGFPVPGMFVVISGELEVMRRGAQGSHHVLFFQRKGGSVGMVTLIEGGPAIYEVQALLPTSCWFYPADGLRRIAQEDEEFRRAILLHYAQRVRQLVDLVDRLSLHSVPERVAQLLLDRHRLRPDSSLVEFDEDQDELGHYIGCTRSAFNRALRLLADMGLIRTTFPVVRLTDLETLERYAGDSQPHAEQGQRNAPRPVQPRGSPGPHRPPSG